MDNLKELELLLTYLKKQYKAVRAELRRMPNGKLMVSSNGNRTSYFNIAEPFNYTHPKGIGRDRALVQMLAHKAYLEELESRLERNIRIVERALSQSRSTDPVQVCLALPKHMGQLYPQKAAPSTKEAENRGWPNPTYSSTVFPRFAEPELKALRPEEWAAMPYRQNSKFKENKVHYTAHAIACRSKGEMGILGIYDELELYYHYDEVLYIDGEYVSPDIIGLRNDGAFIIHEHFGLMDDEYVASNDHKLTLYRKAGFVLGKNLIITWDNEFGGTDLRLIRSMVKDIYHLNREMVF